MAASSALPYRPYTDFLRTYFTGKVQKLPVDVGMTCPVRDGTKGRGGCAFCNGRSFVPRTCAGDVTTQLEAGKQFFARKHRALAQRVNYLAYFQAGSNTYAPVHVADSYFREAMAVDGVVGLVIATRPDCLGEEWLDYLQALCQDTFVMVELGVESLNDRTLLHMGRGHDRLTSERAIQQLAARGIPVGVHLILGLPGESRSDLLLQARLLSTLPVDVVKLHHLQILRGARWAATYLQNPNAFSLFTVDDYVSLVVDYLERLRADIAVERFVSQSPKGALLAPSWGLKPDEVQSLVLHQFAKVSGYQGKKVFW